MGFISKDTKYPLITTACTVIHAHCILSHALNILNLKQCVYTSVLLKEAVIFIMHVL